MNRSFLYYLLISFGVCWLGAALIPLLDVGYGSFASTLIVALICMPAPAFAGWLVQTRILKRPFSELGLTWKLANRSQLYLLPIWLFLLLIFNFVWIALLGNAFGIEAFGTVDFSMDGFLLKLEEMTQGKTDLSEINFPSTYVIFLLVAMSGVVAGATVNLPFTLGEEIGWRGFLFKQLENQSWLKRSLITGIIWGLWHTPLILMGHNYPEHPYLGVLMMVFFCVSLSFPMDWVRRKTNSILGPGAIHGMINASAAGTFLFIQDGDSLMGSIAGFSGALACLTVFGAQYLVTKIIKEKESIAVHLPE
ncbi:MAG TPA: CPBP family intramembrane metalloprotease [Flavobacteriales bacterium]|nr:CPBP family intramembrane metalloprotease [Flavobacteriales bacterium]HPH82903.1 CPBP family intramembrane metalloprotease [Flavobacteriales bacterium]